MSSSRHIYFIDESNHYSIMSRRNGKKQNKTKRKKKTKKKKRQL